MGRWMSLFTTLVALLSLPVLLVVCFSCKPLLLPPPLPPLQLLAYPCANNDPSDAGILGTAILLHFSRRCRLWGRDLGHWLFPVVRYSSIDPLSIFCAGFRSVLISRRKGSALQSLWVRLLSDLPCKSQNHMNVTLVKHIPEVLYVVGSLQCSRRHQPLCWRAHTTVGWSLSLGGTCRR